jgi:hypothetical protein
MLALVVGAPVQADRAVVETTGSSEEVAGAFAGLGNQAGAGVQALLDELAQGSPAPAPTRAGQLLTLSCTPPVRTASETAGPRPAPTVKLGIREAQAACLVVGGLDVGDGELEP